MGRGESYHKEVGIPLPDRLQHIRRRFELEARDPAPRRIFSCTREAGVKSETAAAMSSASASPASLKTASRSSSTVSTAWVSVAWLLRRDVGRDDDDLGAETQRLARQGKTHLPGRAVADKAHAVHRFVGPAGGHEYPHAAHRSVEPAEDPGHDLPRGGQPSPWPPITRRPSSRSSAGSLAPPGGLAVPRRGPGQRTVRRRAREAVVSIMPRARRASVAASAGAKTRASGVSVGSGTTSAKGAKAAGPTKLSGFWPRIPPPGGRPR